MTESSRLRFSRLPLRGLVGLITGYQRVVSPVLPVVFGSACGCRFAPTCSHYAIEALQEHGLAAGAWLALRRLAKCTPLHPGGIDPVPRRYAATAMPKLARPLQA